MRRPLTHLVFLGLSATLFAETIRLGNGPEVMDLDPHRVTGRPEHRILINLFEGLITKDPQTLEILPGVARRWSLSPDGKTYTFELRHQAKWSNGEKITSQDFIYGFRRLVDPKTMAEYSILARPIKNAEAITLGKKPVEELGVNAPNPTTLVIQMEEPTPHFLRLLDYYPFSPLPEKTIEKHGPKWTRPENMVGNGAFQLTEWAVNKLIRLKPNPHYWDAKSVKLKEARFLPIASIDTQERMFRNRELDVTSSVPLTKLAHWRKHSPKSLMESKILGTYLYWFNCRKAPLDKAEVRQALSLAIDRNKIVQFILQGGQSPATQLVPAGTGSYYDPLKLLPQEPNLAQAKALLAKAGYPDGEGFPSIEILFNTNEDHNKIALAIQQMWKQGLGINVTVRHEEWKVFLDSRKNGRFQVSVQGWLADYNDPVTFLEIFQSNAPTNVGHWLNVAFDKKLASSAKERNEVIRSQTLLEAEKVFLEELPAAPIYFYARQYLKSPKVQNWHPNIEDIYPLQRISIE